MMLNVNHQRSTLTISACVILHTVASIVKSVNLTAQLCHVESVENALTTLPVNLVIGVIVIQGLLVMTVKQILMIVRG